MKRCIVYMTAADREAALRIGRLLVAERLAACVNILGAVTSVYEWDGAVEEGEEIAFIAKTSEDRIKALSERVKAVHDYDCPCVVALPLTGGNPAFLDWIGDQTRAE